jgi:hypothetical protein
MKVTWNAFFKWKNIHILKSFTNLIGKGYNLLNVKKLKHGRT